MKNMFFLCWNLKKKIWIFFQIYIFWDTKYVQAKQFQFYKIFRKLKKKFKMFIFYNKHIEYTLCNVLLDIWMENMFFRCWIFQKKIFLIFFFEIWIFWDKRTLCLRNIVVGLFIAEYFNVNTIFSLLHMLNCMIFAPHFNFKNFSKILLKKFKICIS